MPSKDMERQFGLFEASSGETKTAPPSRQALIVPFGKFKDQPVDLLLAQPEYALWLLTAKSSLLRRSHPQMYAWLVSQFGVPETTPEHNRLQNRFLDDDFRLQLFLHLNPSVIEQLPKLVDTDALVSGWKAILPGRTRWAHSSAADSFSYGARLTPEEKEAKQKAMALESLRKDIDKVVVECSKTRDATSEEQRRFVAAGFGQVARVWSPVISAGKPKFEVDGADVDFHVGGSFCVRVDESLPEWPRDGYPQSDLLLYSVQKRYRVEVKPFVGDDYPVILRSMVAKRCNLLLAEAFDADGASWGQVEQVFASQDIQVARLEDILLTPIPESVLCLPLPEVDKATLMGLAAGELERHHKR